MHQQFKYFFCTSITTMCLKDVAGRSCMKIPGDQLDDFKSSAISVADNIFVFKFQQKHPMKWPLGCNPNVQLTTCTSSATSTTATKWWMTTVPFRTFSTSFAGVVSRWPQSGPANLSSHCSNNRFSTMPHSVTSINNQFILLAQCLSLELH